MNNCIYLANVRIDIVDSHIIEQKILDLVKSGDKAWISYVNAHAVNLAQNHKWFIEYLNKSLISYADGQGIRLGAYLLRKKIPPLVNLTRWSWQLLQFCVDNKLSIYFLGASPETLEKAIRNIYQKFPDINLAGSHHGYFEKSPEESIRIANLISEKRPNILLVGMGMPLQEKWIMDYYEYLNVNAILNGGSCIDIIAGTKKVCPQWVSNIGLEWAFRLLHEPKRLFKRYILGNPKFIYYILTKTNNK